MDAKHFIKLNSGVERAGGIGCGAAKLVIRNRIENMGEISERKVLAKGRGQKPPSTTTTTTADCDCKSRTSFIFYTHTHTLMHVYVCVCVLGCICLQPNDAV